MHYAYQHEASFWIAQHVTTMQGYTYLHVPGWNLGAYFESLAQGNMTTSSFLARVQAAVPNPVFSLIPDRWSKCARQVEHLRSNGFRNRSLQETDTTLIVFEQCAGVLCQEATMFHHRSSYPRPIGNDS
ncbi:hypothetical protein M378DRAFT_171132 [Amanita muscaria Koide BX008]|uniref:Uncharacterized protein n=1 Tax=Amanita muscaria (strain Koide BX008) TaxID=946122 RepID=A0A0C2SVE2_AMAMK|nr:hypothetical protein M378DRAFT_171132 [Amanita muscaria Koide BX008]